MRIENLYPKPLKIEDVQRLADDLATVKEVYDDAVATYGARARDLLERSGGDAIAAISLLMLVADQHKQAAEKAAEPSLSEQALAATVRDQRDAIDALTSERDKFEKWWRDAVHEAASLNADLAQREVDVEQITRLQSILCAATATAYGRARMYSEYLHALPIGTVVRDEADQAWTRIDDEDGGVWATPTGDDTLSSADLVAGSSIYLAWVAVL